MKRYFMIFLALVAAVGCKSTPVEEVAFPQTQPFGQSVRSSFDMMVQNAQPQELVFGTIKFELNKAVLNREAKETLNRVVPKLTGITGSVIIEGYADLVPFEDNAKQLAKQRAVTVADYLHAAGVWKERLVIHNFADTRPSASNGGSEERSGNRQVVIRVFPQGEGMTGKDAAKTVNRVPASSAVSTPAAPNAEAAPPAGGASTPPVK